MMQRAMGFPSCFYHFLFFFSSFFLNFQFPLQQNLHKLNTEEGWKEQRGNWKGGGRCDAIITPKPIYYWAAGDKDREILSWIIPASPEGFTNSAPASNTSSTRSRSCLSWASQLTLTRQGKDVLLSWPGVTQMKQSQALIRELINSSRWWWGLFCQGEFCRV